MYKKIIDFCRVNYSWCIYILLIFFLSILAFRQLDIQTIFSMDPYNSENEENSVWLTDGGINKDILYESDQLEKIYILFDAKEDKKEGAVFLYLSAPEKEQTWELDTAELNFGEYTEFPLEERWNNLYGENLHISIVSEGDGLGVKEWNNGELCIRFLYTHIPRKAILLFLAGMTVCVLGCSICLARLKWRLEIKVCVLAMLIGVFYLLLIPYSESPDDMFHFRRIFEISQGGLLSKAVPGQTGAGGNLLPGNLNANLKEGSGYAEVLKNIGARVERNNIGWSSFSNTALYAPIAYIPQATGAWLARLFTDKVLLIVTISRFFAMIASTVMTTLAIYFMPFKKYIILLVAFIPVFMQEAVSLGTDSFVNAFLSLYISYILYLLYENKVIGWKRCLIISVMSICVALCKVVYLPLCFLLLLLPEAGYKTKRARWHHLLITWLLAAGGYLGWTFLTSGFIDGFAGIGNAREQVVFILSHPIGYLEIIYRTICDQGLDLLLGAMGGKLGYVGEIEVNYLLCVGNLILLSLMSCCSFAEEKIPCKKVKVVLGIVVLFVTVLTFTGLYVQFTAVKAEKIRGLQGRYFIPLLLPVGVFLTRNKMQTGGKRVGEYLFPYLGYLSLIALYQIYNVMGH